MLTAFGFIDSHLQLIGSSETHADEIIPVAMKIQIENPMLRGQSQDWVPQRVASVYSNGEGFHVYAPARATGEPL